MAILVADNTSDNFCDNFCATILSSIPVVFYRENQCLENRRVNWRINWRINCRLNWRRTLGRIQQKYCSPAFWGSFPVMHVDVGARSGPSRGPAFFLGGAYILMSGPGRGPVGAQVGAQRFVWEGLTF